MEFQPDLLVSTEPYSRPWRHRDLMAEILLWPSIPSRLGFFKKPAQSEQYVRALHYAAEHNCKATTVYILDSCRVESTLVHGRTALHVATNAGSHAIMEILLLKEIGSEINQKTASQVTALHLAAEKNDKVAIKL